METFEFLRQSRMDATHHYAHVMKVIMVVLLAAIGFIEVAFAQGEMQQLFSVLPDPHKCKMSLTVTVSEASRMKCAMTCLGKDCSVFQYNTTASQCNLYSDVPAGLDLLGGSPYFASEKYHEMLNEEEYVAEDGWLLFVRRQDGSVDFNQAWPDYRCGFGNRSGEFWLGLETLHMLTADKPYKLRAEMTDWDGNEYFAEYSTFQVGAENTAYTLSVSGYDGTSTAGDAMTFHDGYKFSTLDVENDVCGCNCAVDYNGGWWYKNCHVAHPTGLYFPTMTLDNKGLMWHPVGSLGVGYSFKEMKLMIKP